MRERVHVRAGRALVPRKVFNLRAPSGGQCAYRLQFPQRCATAPSQQTWTFITNNNNNGRDLGRTAAAGLLMTHPLVSGKGLGG